MNAFAKNPQYVFMLALAVAGLCTICYTLFLTDIYRDTAHVYAVFARAIGDGDFFEGIATQVPMLNITLAGLLSYCGLEAVKALSLVAGLFYLATCFPLRKLLERYLSPLAAAWGCVLYACAPKMIRFACAPLLESSRIFFLTAAVLYFLRCSEKPNLKNAMLFGISAGLLSVSRVEGIFVAAAMLGGYLLFLLIFRKNVVWKKQLVIPLAAIICAVAVVSPFCAMNYSKSGYFITDARLAYYLKLTPTTPTKPVAQQTDKKTVSNYTSDDSPKQGLDHDISSLVRGSYEVYLALALLGAVLIIKRRQWKNDYWLLIALTAIQCAMYIITISAYRYYLFMIPLFMMFTITGAGVLRELAVQCLPYKAQMLCIVACIALAAGQIANGVSRAFSSKGKDFQAAGKWIKEYGKKHFPERKLVIFAPQMTETAYWSGAVHTDGYEKPLHDPATFQDFDLAVVHRKKSFGMEKRSDLEHIPDTPHSKNIWIFKLKPQEKK